MICTNELLEIQCNKRQILEPLIILLSAYAPHISEELWQLAGHNESIVTASYPIFNEQFVLEHSYKYPVSFNGKTRFQKEFSLQLP